MFAAVIVGVNSKDVNRLFDYKIPDHLAGVIQVGHRVFVPFGPRHVQATSWKYMTQVMYLLQKSEKL